MHDSPAALKVRFVIVGSQSPTRPIDRVPAKIFQRPNSSVTTSKTGSKYTLNERHSFSHSLLDILQMERKYADNVPLYMKTDSLTRTAILVFVLLLCPSTKQFPFAVQHLRPLPKTFKAHRLPDTQQKKTPPSSTVHHAFLYWVYFLLTTR